MMSLAWVFAIIVLFFIEIISVGFICIWFIIGGIAALIVSCFSNSLIFQMIVFVVVSIAAYLVSLLIEKLFVSKTSVVPSDKLVGKVGEVSRKVGKNSHGEVEVNGKYFTACSNHSIDEGKKVRILKVEDDLVFVDEE